MTLKDRETAIVDWLHHDEDDVADIAAYFHKYDATFWSDLSELWDAATEQDGPLHAATVDRNAALIRVRDGDGDTSHVLVTFYIGDVKYATKALDCDDLHADSDTTGYAAAAEALATIEAAILETVHQAARPALAHDLAGHALAELESGAVTDKAGQAFLDGVQQTAVYLATGVAVPGSDLAALLHRMNRAEASEIVRPSA